MEQVNSHKETTIQVYPPNDGSPPGSGPEYSRSPKAKLTLDFSINAALVGQLQHLGFAVRYLQQMPPQEFVVRILAPSGKPLWRSVHKTKGIADYAFTFDKDEMKSLKRYFTTGNTLELNINPLNDLAVCVSLVTLE